MTFQALPELMNEGDQLWHNNTQVIRARLLLNKPTGGRLELFLLEPVGLTMEQALARREVVTWKALVRGGKRWKQGEAALEWTGTEGQINCIQAKRKSQEEGHAVLELSWNFDAPFAIVVEQLGAIPIPPYLGRDAEASDDRNYQTIYAEVPGSVAAPTAGLHYDESLWDAIHAKGVDSQAVTLHVGAGTFKPLGSGGLEEHAMHAEHCSISKTALESLAIPGMRKWATGTTTLRTLESLFWFAVVWRSTGTRPNEIPQWVWKDHAQWPSDWGWVGIDDAARWMLDQGVTEVQFATQIMVIPGYRIRSIDFLITNFHMPKSTLLCLVAASIGGRWKEVYQRALDSGYRFLSYGDGSVLEVKKDQ